MKGISWSPRGSRRQAEGLGAGHADPGSEPADEVMALTQPGPGSSRGSCPRPQHHLRAEWEPQPRTRELSASQHLPVPATTEKDSSVGHGRGLGEPKQALERRGSEGGRLASPGIAALQKQIQRQPRGPPAPQPLISHPEAEDSPTFSPPALKMLARTSETFP